MRILYPDMFVFPVNGGVGSGGTTRIAIEEARTLSRHGHETHFLATDGSSPGAYFDGVAFCALPVPPICELPRAKIGPQNRHTAKLAHDYCVKHRIDAVISHSNPGFTLAFSKLVPKVPVIFVHHLWPSTNLFFDTGRFRQLQEMSDRGIYVVFNSVPNIKRHRQLARSYAKKDLDAKTQQCISGFLKWSESGVYAMKTLFSCRPYEYTPVERKVHLVASRCAPDKRIHVWADKASRPVHGAFTSYLDSEYERQTVLSMNSNDAWSYDFGVSYPKVLKLMRSALSNVATGPTDSFGLTVFEAASFGTPSVLGRTGAYSAVEDLVSNLGETFPVFDYSGARSAERMRHALLDAESWSDSRRRSLCELVQSRFSKKRLVKERTRLLEALL